jgi:hypothetical protein
MITVVTNFDRVISDRLDRLNNFDAQRMCLIQAEYIAGEWRKRIHMDGIAADGSQIGTYSDGYMKTRVSRYHRTGDRRVIASLTRQMELNMTAFPTVNGAAVGYPDSYNYRKSQWVEKACKKRIFGLTDQEAADMLTIAEEEVKKALS